MSNKELWEGFVSAAQRRAVWASKADGGKGHPDNKKKKSKKEDTAVDEASCGYSSKKKTNEVSKDMMGRYLKKAPASAADGGRDSVMGSGKEKQGVKKVVNRITGTQTAVDKMTGKAKVPATEKEANEPSQAVKDFLAKGGKIKKLPPAHAQGYHGKDDPGKDMHGVMDKPDTDKFKTRKKVKSMENKTFDDLRNQLSESKLEK